MGYKRISRARKRDLQQPDEFLTWSSRFLVAVTRYRTQIVWGLVGILAISIGLVGYGLHARRAEAKAAAMLSRLVEAYQAERASAASNQALEGVEAEFEALISSYGRRTAGQMAKVYFAGFQSEAGQTDKAIELYQTALDELAPGTYFHAAALNGLGYAYEQSGDYTAALNCFKQLAEGDEPFFKADGLYNAARMYALTGAPDKSREAMEQVAASRPAYLYAELINAKIN